jgi:hypothetical protein
MRRSLLLFVGVLLCCASVASAQVYPLPGGAIGVYSDEEGSSCNFTDTASGPVQFFMYHLESPGMTAIEFKLDLTGFLWSQYLGDLSPFALKIGNFADGISIAYQTCLAGTIYLGKTVYDSRGLTPTCHRIYITKNPNSGAPGATTPMGAGCNGVGWVQIAGSYGTFNDDGSCPCPSSTAPEETSWGKIKSLYQ